MIYRDKVSSSAIIGLMLKILMLACLVFSCFWVFGVNGNLQLGSMLFLLCCMNLYFFIRIKNPLSVIFLISHFNYLILFIVFYLDLPFSYLEQQNEREVYDAVVLLDFIFYLILGISLTRSSFDFSLQGRKLWVPTTVLYWFGVFCVIVNLVAVVRYIGLPYLEYHGKHTIFSELGWLFLALAILFDKRLSLTSKKSMLLYALMICSILLGARLQISFFIVAFLIRFVFPVSRLFFYFSLAFVVCAGIFVGIVRDVFGIDMSLEYVFSTINQGASLRTSAVYLMAINEGFFGIHDRILASLATFVFAWLPSSVFGSVGHLNIRITQYSEIQGNGGFIGTYLFLYFGLIGSFLFTAALAFATNRAIIKAPIFAAAILVTSYRWQLYNLLPVLKIMFLLFLIGFIIKFLIEISQQKRLRLSEQESLIT